MKKFLVELTLFIFKCEMKKKKKRLLFHLITTFYSVWSGSVLTACITDRSDTNQLNNCS